MLFENLTIANSVNKYYACHRYHTPKTVHGSTKKRIPIIGKSTF